MCWAAFLVVGVSHAAPAVLPGGILFAASDIAALRAQPQRTASLLKRCDKELMQVAQPVKDFSPPPHYTRTGARVTDVSRQFNADGGMAYRAALCLVITGDARYGRHGADILSAWGRVLKTVDSRQGGAEMNFFVPRYVVAASLIRDRIDWDDTSFRSLLTRLARPNSHANTARNNHANWGVWLDASIAAYLGDPNQLRLARARWVSLMQQQVADDGSLPLEICRSDTNDYCGGPSQGKNGLSYTHYTLLPTALAAQVFALAGMPVWDTPAGARLGRAYARAASWTLHPDTFPYFAANHGQLNGVRNTAYFSLLQRHDPNADGAQVLASGRAGADGLELTLIFAQP